MRNRSHSSAPPSAPRSVSCALDLVCLTAEKGSLVVLLHCAAAGGQRLPSAAWRGGAALDETAIALTRAVLGRDTMWREQAGTAVDGAHPDRAGISVTYATLVPRGSPAPTGGEWHDVSKLPAGVSPRHRLAVASAVAHVRNRMDHEPVAFRVLPAVFTLGDLQEIYELLLGRRLHKASFRRALQAAYLVEPTEEWRSEGRGRPAQLFRFAPKRRRNARRTMRFEMLDV